MTRRTILKRVNYSKNKNEEDDEDFVPTKVVRRSLSNSQLKGDTDIEPGFRSKLASILKDTTSNNRMKESRNILTTINKANNGILHHRVSESLEEKARSKVVESLKSYAVYKSSSPFEKRITAITWHPTQTCLFAVGNKWGSILLWNYENDKDFNAYVDGIGPGGSIQNIKFHPTRNNLVYTCSIDGTMALKNLTEKEDHNIKLFQSTDSYERWYTAFDVSFPNKLLVCGNNKGTMTLMTSEGEDTVWEKKLHKGKIHDIRFSPREPWLMVSTSIDKSLKIWDIRNVKEKEPLVQILHNKPVNSAVFSCVDGTRILTTDQHSELRVYTGPQWTCQNIIPHPHRQFQHLTPMIATWHPLVDLIVVGRYPDPKFEDYVEGEARSIDLIDPDKGSIEFQMSIPTDNRIASLNQFNPTGEALLSGVAGTVNVWKSSFKRQMDENILEKYEEFTCSANEIKIEKWPDFGSSKYGGGSKKAKSKKTAGTKKTKD